MANRVDSWLSDARRLSKVVLLRDGTNETRRGKRLKLATDIVEIDTLSTHLAYDRLTDRHAVTGLGEIRLRMLMLLPVIASLEDRLAALGEEALRRQPELKRLLEDLAQWIVERRQRAATGRADSRHDRRTSGGAR